MHQLERSAVNPPPCLSDYDYKARNWDELDKDCKSFLRAALVEMQGIPGVTTEEGAKEYGVRCAYCEGAIYDGKGHIEHFRRKDKKHFPELTFEWTNLFLACGSKTHCGHYKDNSAQEYNPDHLIKPDDHDPEQYLYFHSSGEVRVRGDLQDAQDKRRAEETIRVFGLNEARLRGKRKNAVSEYEKKILADLDTIALWSPEDQKAYFQSEIKATCCHPYSTAIKHFLQIYK